MKHSNFELQYPFTPKSTKFLEPGQFWPVPITTGGFACGRVLQLRKVDSKTDSRVFLAALMDWWGPEPPTSTSLIGATFRDVGAMHVRHFKGLDCQIAGHRPLELDGLDVPKFVSPAGASPRMVSIGFDALRPVEIKQDLSLPQIRQWGYEFISRLADRTFSEKSMSEIMAAAETPKGTPPLSLEQAFKLIQMLKERGLPVHSMESYELLKGHVSRPLRLDFSILGMDAERNWEAHESHRIANELAVEKLKQAQNSGARLEIIIWS